MRLGCTGWPGVGSCWQGDVALPGQGLSMPRQVKGMQAVPPLLPGCGAERKAQSSVEQGVRACSTKLWSVLPLII